MTPTASRALLRRSQFAIRRSGYRNASTTAEAASKAKETAQQVQSKASEGLSKVQSSAGNVANKAGDAAANAGGRVGGLVNFVTGRLIPGTIYYSRVGLELGKILFEQRKMSPPSLATFQQIWTGAYQYALKPPTNVLANLRNTTNAQWVAAGVVGAEVLGFFTVGEMLGRLKLVGYRGGKHDEHH